MLIVFVLLLFGVCVCVCVCVWVWVWVWVCVWVCVCVCVCVFGLAELPCLTSLVLSLFLGSVVGMLFPFVVVLLFLLCHACWLAFLLLSSLHRSLAHPQSLKTKMY